MKSEYIRFVAVTKPCDSIYLKFVPLDKKLTIRAMVVVEEFIKNNLIPSMLEIDSLFGISYSSIYDSGAYYDSLRIREATEFELDLILKMPSRGNVMRVQVGNGSYGFAKYYCNSLPANMLTSTKMKESFSLIFQKRCFTSSQNV